ncbi:MAG: hypothetical protein IIA67_12140, partial [Planctomycetes bacterium]|nr:hypothetical protein [Planctomycetota bacterium]
MAEQHTLTATDDDHDEFEPLMEEFSQRYRRGEQPTVEEYAERYPHLAEKILDVF